MEDLALYPPETYNHFTFDKFLAFPSADSDMETFRKFADEHFLCFIHEDKAWELTQKNLSKATGIRFLADRLGVPVKDTYAFGDSTNDLLMLQFAGNSIAMGDSDPLILPHCTLPDNRYRGQRNCQCFEAFSISFSRTYKITYYHISIYLLYFCIFRRIDFGFYLKLKKQAM